MKLGLESLDYIIFFVYFVIVASYGYWVYKNKGKQTADSKDFSWRKVHLHGGLLVRQLLPQISQQSSLSV
jgi:hypothetical protein